MKTTKLNNDELLDLYINRDMSSLEIAKKFKVCVSSVCRRLNKLGEEVYAEYCESCGQRLDWRYVK